MFGNSDKAKEKRLKKAAYANDLAGVIEEIKNGANPMGKLTDDRPLLAYIFYHGKFDHEKFDLTELVRLIKTNGGELATDAYFSGYFISAVRNKKWPLAKALFSENNLDLTMKTEERAAFEWAVVHENWEFAQQIADKGGLNTDVKNGKSSAHKLINMKDIPDNIFEYVIRSTPDINKTHHALHDAIDGDRHDAIALLRQMPAFDLAVLTEKGRDAFHKAVSVEKSDFLAEFLKDESYTIDRPDNSGDTPLCVAIVNKSPSMFKMIVDEAKRRGVDLDLLRALTVALEQSNIDMARRVIELGVDVNARDAEGKTWLMMAVMEPQERFIVNLLAVGARADAADNSEKTVYDYAKDAEDKALKADWEAHRKIVKIIEESAAPAKENAVTAVKDDSGFTRVSDFAVDVEVGGGLTLTFNFWTGQVTHRDKITGQMVVQPFNEVPRFEAVEEARQKLIELKGNPPPLALALARVNKKQLTLGPPDVD